MPLAMCPRCDHEFIVSGNPTLTLGQPITCPACAARLRVVWLEPCELDWEPDALDDELNILVNPSQKSDLPPSDEAGRSS